MEYNEEPIYDIVKTYLNLYPNLNETSKIDRNKHYILYECAAALYYKMYLWTHLPNEILDRIGAIRNKHINSARDRLQHY